jgi:hypothetical protein
MPDIKASEGMAISLRRLTSQFLKVQRGTEKPGNLEPSTESGKAHLPLGGWEGPALK